MSRIMNISNAAKVSGVPAKTIRYYESIGLIAQAARTEGGYRVYSANEIETLRFIQRARSLGFSVKDVEALLALWRDRSRASGDVKVLAANHVAVVERKIADLEEMRDTLVHLIGRCHGDERPDCPILKGLAGQAEKSCHD